MTTANVIPLRHQLVEYSQGRINDATLWRALFTHHDWLVPVTELTFHYRPSEGGEYVLPGDGYTFDKELFEHPQYLLLFTDPEPAFLAKSKGIPLGMFTSGMSGVEVFGKVNPKWEGIMVNPGSPQEQTWFVPKESFPALAPFAERFRLEEEFTRFVKIGQAQANSHEELSKLVKRLREFQEFEVPVWESTREPLSENDGRSPVGNMILCTWADCIEAVKATLTPDQRAQVKKIILDGATIFQSMASFGYAGVAINPRGPGSGVRMKLSDGSGPTEIVNAWGPGR